MNNLNTYTDCSGCDLYSLPAAPVCVRKPILSQITRLVILPNAAQLPVDWTVGEDWEAVVNNTSTTVAYGRILHGKGGVPDPAEASVNLGKIDRRITRRRYNLDFELTVNSQTREILRKMQRGLTDFRFWYFTAGDWLFGGATGIRPLVVSAVLPLLPGGNDFELGRIRIEFASDIDPVAAYAPSFADVAGCLSLVISGMYPDDDSAALGGVTLSDIYEVSADNIWGLPEGIVKLRDGASTLLTFDGCVDLTIYEAYPDDDTAGADGVPLNSMYRVSVDNIWALPTNVLKLRKNGATGSGSLPLEIYELSADNIWGLPEGTIKTT